MKKILVLFILLDLVFVGVILILNKQPERSISSVSNEEIPGLTEGQQNKWRLIKSFHFQKTAASIEFQTDLLQMICDSSSLIELRYLAQNIAIAGEPPSISHVFSCFELKKDLSQTTLSTPLDDFKLMHQQKKLKLPQSELTSNQIYPSEEFPTDWKLAEIKVNGIYTFTINQFEIEKVLQTSFGFSIPTSVE